MFFFLFFIPSIAKEAQTRKALYNVSLGGRCHPRSPMKEVWLRLSSATCLHPGLVCCPLHVWEPLESRHSQGECWHQHSLVLLHKSVCFFHYFWPLNICFISCQLNNPLFIFIFYAAIFGVLYQERFPNIWHLFPHISRKETSLTFKSLNNLAKLWNPSLYEEVLCYRKSRKEPGWGWALGGQCDVS